MMNNLIIAATIFFAAGALDYAYRLLRTAYWDVKDMLRERKWRKKEDEFLANQKAAEDAVPSEVTVPVAI